MIGNNDFIFWIFLFGIGILLFLVMALFKRWVFVRSGFVESKVVETLNGKKFVKYEGFLYVSPRVSEFRKDCPLYRDFKAKKNMLRKQLLDQQPSLIGVDSELDKAIYPLLLTREEAERLGIDLKYARLAALTWWKTGFFKRKATPLRSRCDVKNESGKHKELC